ARSEDNISLLRGMSEKEVRKLIRKGIFTVTQLSCTFRPRRSSKRAGRSVQPHYHALQALAVREKKVHVLGTPVLPAKSTDVYFDIEGDSERSFVYLLGVIVVNGGTEERYSCWADDEGQEQQAFRQLIEKLRTYGDFTLFHYGSYESAFLKRMRRCGVDPKFIETMMACSVNVLSLVHSHVYFPTFSNGLKEVGGYLGCRWTDDVESGIRVYLRRIPAPCAHLFGRLRRSTECLWDSLMIQAHDGSQDLMPLLTDVPPMAVRHLGDQAPHVPPLQQAADRMALATVFSGVLGRSVP